MIPERSVRGKQRYVGQIPERLRGEIAVQPKAEHALPGGQGVNRADAAATAVKRHTYSQNVTRLFRGSPTQIVSPRPATSVVPRLFRHVGKRRSIGQGVIVIPVWSGNSPAIFVDVREISAARGNIVRS